MPNYHYKDKVSGKSLDVTRKVDERDNPPLLPEVLEIGMTTEEHLQADWERVYVAPVVQGFEQYGHK